VLIVEHAITLRQLRLLKEADLAELGFRLGEKRAVLNWIENHNSGASPVPSDPVSPAPSTSNQRQLSVPHLSTPTSSRPNVTDSFKVCCLLSISV